MRAFTTLLTAALSTTFLALAIPIKSLARIHTTPAPIQHEADTIKSTASYDASFAFLRGSDEDMKNNVLFAGNTTKKGSLGTSAQGRVIEAWYFPGTSTKRALVIGGVHGSELSSIEVANELIRQLQQGITPYYSVVVIPCLFPDNAAAAVKNAPLIGTTDNIGRYTKAASVDPNRQMPTPGKAFIDHNPVDHLNREIEKENRLLLALINEYRPERLVNLHAIRDKTHAGIYADPRTDEEGFALGFEADSMLAIAMAKYIHNSHGYTPGNNLSSKPTAIYYKDPLPVAKGFYQKRNYLGSGLSNNRGCGISLGTWATTTIKNSEDTRYNRDAICLITVEFPGSKRSADYANKQQHDFFVKQVKLYASAISHIFLK